jgi:hypothetical protein
MDEQPRLTDLIPIRLSRHLMVFVVGLALVAGLESLYHWSQGLAATTTDGRIAAFDLDSEGSLGAWFSSTLLLLASLVAILVYRIRRHRTDDYQGYYRVWLWASFCWLLMSMDESASLHEGFKEMMAHLTGTRLLGDGSIWWTIPYFFLLGSVGTRLLVDMRPCRLSSAALMGTAACFAVAILGQLGLVMPDAGAREVMVEEGCEMVGMLLLLLAMTLHARYVILEAQGLLPARKPKATDSKEGAGQAAGAKIAKASKAMTTDDEAEEEEEDEDSGRSSLTVHPPHGVPRPASPAVVPASAKPAVQSSRPAVTGAAALRMSSAAAGTSAGSGVENESDSPAKKKITKAERKAMRKRLEQMRSDRDDRLRDE